MFLYNLEHPVNLSFLFSSPRFGESQSQILQTKYIDYWDELASEIGAKPDLLSLLFRDPELAVRLYFRPCTPIGIAWWGLGDGREPGVPSSPRNKGY